MFNLPFKLRVQTEYCTPKGPNFKWAPWVRFSVNGTHIQLKVPRHRTNIPAEPLHAKAYYNLNKLHLDYCFSDRPQWRELPILFRVWEFYGSWFTGRLGATHADLAIIARGEPAKNVSFFHPRAFESAMADYLTFYHGEERTSKKKEQEWLAPSNWSAITHLPCIAASFDVVENVQNLFQKGKMTRYLCVPITDHHILCLSFFITRNQFLPIANGPDRDVDEWINIAPMKALADDVINSLQITLSPEAEAQQAKALSGLEDASLIKEFPPLKW